MKKRDILMQGENGKDYAILCTEGVCKFKKQIDNDFKEVATIIQEEDGFRLQKFSPLTIENTLYSYVEECLYHLLYEFGILKKEDSAKIGKYFGEKI